jgi:hypothetical protein
MSTYKVNVECLNCHSWDGEVNIPKGTSAFMFFETMDCPNCGCSNGLSAISKKRLDKKKEKKGENEKSD